VPFKVCNNRLKLDRKCQVDHSGSLSLREAHNSRLKLDRKCQAGPEYTPVTVV
jgi:hypothetical protein